MSDLIWIGNTLYPRWIVFAAFAAPICAVLFSYIVHDAWMLFKSLRKK